MNPVQQSQTDLDVTQKPQNPPYSSRQLGIVGIVGLAIGVVSYGAGYALGAIHKPSCSDALGLCILNSLVGGIVMALVSIGLTIVLLKKFKIQHTWQIAILGNASVYTIPPFMQDLPTSHVLVVASAGVAFGVTYGLFYWIFNAGKIDPTTRLAIAAVVAVSAVIGYGRLNDIASQKQYDNEQTNKIQSYDFDLYKPGYIPAGYKLYTLTPSYEDAPAPYLEIEYLYGQNDIGDPPPFTIYTFKAYDKFKPPLDCGPEHPDDILTFAFPCEPNGTDANGNIIYKHTSDFSNDYNSYIKIGDTIVTIQTTDLDFNNTESQKVLQGLQSTTADELQKIYEQNQ